MDHSSIAWLMRMPGAPPGGENGMQISLPPASTGHDCIVTWFARGIGVVNS